MHKMQLKGLYNKIIWLHSFSNTFNINQKHWVYVSVPLNQSSYLHSDLQQSFGETSGNKSLRNPLLHWRCCQTWPPEAQGVGSGLCPDVSFHTCTTQREVLAQSCSQQKQILWRIQVRGRAAGRRRMDCSVANSLAIFVGCFLYVRLLFFIWAYLPSLCFCFIVFILGSVAC